MRRSVHAGDPNLNEWETKISLLERSNFDLKMQVYYLNEKLNSNIEGEIQGTPSEESEDYEYDYGKRTSDLLTLTEENSSSKRQIIELEAELIKLKIEKNRETERYESALRSKPKDDEEAQRREREAAFAIAEHDAIMIHKLEQEVQQLIKQKEHDKNLVDQLACELLEKNDLLKDKTYLIADLNAAVHQMKATNGSLLDQVRQFEVARITSTSDSNEYKDKEIKFLQNESVFLQDQLGRYKTATKTQEETLNNFKAFIATKEALNEQMASDLRKCLQSRDELQQQCHELKLTNSRYQQQLLENQKNGVDTLTIDAYRERESELLNALEGVVKKYQELESRYNS